MKYGKLTFLKIDENKSNKCRTYWICKCDCGNIKSIRSDCVKNGTTYSCGCACKTCHEKIHGQSMTKLYHVWATMKHRCNNHNNKNYRNYGGRGIEVCDEWNKPDSYPIFYKWAIENGYKNGLTIDRINVNEGYNPNNCRWVTQSEQCNNQRRNVLLTYNGETLNLNQWAKKLKINKNTFWMYIRKKKMSIEDVLKKRSND